MYLNEGNMTKRLQKLPQSRGKRQGLWQIGLKGLLCAQLLSFATPSELWAQKVATTQSATTKKTVSVRGRVQDKMKEDLVGVGVKILGTTRGTATDINGRFRLDAVPVGVTLEFTSLGMKPQRVKVTKEMTLSIVLEEDTNLLGELVVTGYQEVRRERMTGAVSTIRASDIKNIDVKSVDQILKGSVSGVAIQATGRPGEDARIRVRGTNSLSGNASPIWIIDGMPLQGEAPDVSSSSDLESSLMQTGIGNISPDDIESITVLKDAAASAIYGARAANGVIVIKTKSGREGKPRYSITAHYGVTARPESNIRMMNSAEKIRFEREVFQDQAHITGRVGELLDDVSKGLISSQEAETEIARLSQINTDWFKTLYRQSQSMQVNASLSGGSQATKYYSSVNFLNEDGSELNNNYKRLRLNSKLQHDIAKNISIQADLSGTYRANQSTASIISPLRYAVYANPYETADGYDKSYDMRYSRLRPGHLWETLNVRDEMMRNTNSSRYLEASLNAQLVWRDILPGLTYTAHGVVSASSTNSRTIEGEHTYTNMNNNWLTNNRIYNELTREQVRGSLREGTFTSNSYTLRNTLAYALNLDDKHYIDAMAGAEASSRLMYSSSAYSPVFDELHRVVGDPKLPEGTDLNQIRLSSLTSTGKYESKLVSFFANATYSYRDRYVLSGSIRYDGSDIIGNSNQFTPLWNMSAKWNIHQESFLKAKWIDQLSLRVGYGFTGSIDKSALPFVIMRFTSSRLYDNVAAPSSFNYANPNIKWQTKRDMNIGAEASLWDQRLRLGVNFYNNFIFDLLDRRSRPYSSGVGSITQNVATLINRGWEIDLGVDLLRIKNLTWSVRGNVSINTNKITETFYKTLEEVPSSSSRGGRILVQEYPVGGWFGYKFAGIDPITGHALAYQQDGSTFDMDQLGNVTLNLKAPTLTYFGESIPPITGGFSTNVAWKALTLNMSFEFQAGHLIPSFEQFRLLGTTNRHISDQARWRAPGDQTSLPPIGSTSASFANYTYDRNLESGNYLRASYLTLGYRLPHQWIGAIGLQGARVSFTASNLFTLTKYRGIDPALLGSFSYPNSRKYNISLNLEF